MGGRITGTVRDKSPCFGCTREQKAPGCHDRCPEFKAWRQKVDAVNAAMQEYKKQPFSKIM